jgi:hypothetical protein
MGEVRSVTKEVCPLISHSDLRVLFSNVSVEKLPVCFL